MGMWQITFWDVGQGDATDIRLPDGSHILIDAGPTLKENNPLPPWFLREGSPKIALAVVTHNHADHFGGFNALCREVSQTIERLAVMNDAKLHDEKRTADLELFLRSMMDRKRDGRSKIELLNSEGELYADECFRLRLAYPKSLPAPENLPKNVNLSSMVILVEDVTGAIKDPLVVWGGDNSLQNVGKVCGGMSPYVLMGPHHGHPEGHPKTPEYEKFFKKTMKPRCVYISVGRRNRYSLPDSYYIKGAARAGVRVCCSQLAVNCAPERECDVFEGSGKIGVDKPINSVQCRGALRVFAVPHEGICFDEHQAAYEKIVKEQFPFAPCNRKCT